MHKKITDKQNKLLLIVAVLLMGLSLLITGCNSAEKTKKNDNVGIANPASEFCEEKGGTLDIVEGKDGQKGICKFDDGSECEEWAFYKGECNKGDSITQKTHVCTQEEKENKICTKEYNPVCGDNGKEYSNPCTACSSGEISSWTQGKCQQSSSSKKESCESMGGKWIESANECESISEDECNKLGGEFNACASACRNDPNAEICTMQCVMVCSF